MPADEAPRRYSTDLSTSSANFFQGPVVDPGPLTPTDFLSSLESDEGYVAPPILLPIIAYQPIVIPREPTLDEVLSQASDGTNLEEVTQLKLCVISENVSLQRVAAYCPLLTTLDLTGSALTTLRDLGCMMTNLRHLNVSRCGLRSLDGTSGLGSVTHLVANCNQIEYLDPCSFLEELQDLSVQGNVIRSTYNLHCFSVCPLKSLQIDGNPIMDEVQNIEETATRIIPSLMFFNGKRVREEPTADAAPESHTETSSASSSSGSFSSLEKSLDSFQLIQAAAAATDTGERVLPGANQRPASADLALHQHSHQRQQAASHRSHRPLSASLVRLRQKHWSISMGAPKHIDLTALAEFDFDKQFPFTHPRATPVELELGVIGAMQRVSTGRQPQQQQTADLLKLAENWRRLRSRAQRPPKPDAKGAADVSPPRAPPPRLRLPPIIDELSELPALSLAPPPQNRLQ